MSDEAWPTPQQPSREPLPRVEDLPIAEQGYEQESVRAAFDSFYRHAAQLDAALRTLEAVDSFHRQAAALRADLRVLRSSGWSQQSWPTTPAYGYLAPSPRDRVSPAVWRIAGEVAFLIVVAVALGVAKVSWWVIVLVMAGAFLVVALIEWATSRDFEFVRGEPLPVHPVVEAEPANAERFDEPDSLGWTAFEEAQEPSDAMTIIGAPPAVEDVPVEERAEELADDEEPEAAVAEPSAEPEPAPEPEPEPEPEAEREPEQPPEPSAPAEPRRRWWRRRERDETREPEPDVPAEPRHVRILPPDEQSNEPHLDPWEQGFDDASLAAGEEADVGEDTAEGERALAVERDESERA
jgi:hypothetical protein